LNSSRIAYLAALAVGLFASVASVSAEAPTGNACCCENFTIVWSDAGTCFECANAPITCSGYYCARVKDAECWDNNTGDNCSLTTLSEEVDFPKFTCDTPPIDCGGGQEKCTRTENGTCTVSATNFDACSGTTCSTPAPTDPCGPQ
jgi:hypothetical protein